MKKITTGVQAPARLWPADKIEHWPIERLTPYARNARTHTKEDVEKVAASIVRWGFTNPILVDETGNIIAGHCRLLALQKLKHPTIPVIVARDWSADEKRAYCIADNQLAARAGWDFGLLQAELESLKLDSFDLDLLGFDPKDLETLLASGGNGGLTDPDSVPELEDKAITQIGDTWLLGSHRVHCGDCTNAEAVAAAIGDDKPALMVTDPPYGVDYDPTWRGKSGDRTVRSKGKVLNDDRADWREAWAHFQGDVAYVWHGALHAGIVAESLRASGLELRSQIVWAKQHFTFSRGNYHWQHETCWYAVRKGASGHWAGDRKQTTIWEIANNSAIGNPAREQVWGHGTQKPVECMRRPVVNNSRPGEVIYDPFLGTGTTIIAAEMTGRHCVGLELAPQYVDVIVRRWQSFTGKEATLNATGQSFAERSSAAKGAVAARLRGAV